MAFRPLQAVVLMGNCRNSTKKQMEVGRGWLRSPRDSCWTYVTNLGRTGMGVWEKAGLLNPCDGGCRVMGEAHELTLKGCRARRPRACSCSLYGKQLLGFERNILCVLLIKKL